MDNLLPNEENPNSPNNKMDEVEMTDEIVPQEVIDDIAEIVQEDVPPEKQEQVQRKIMQLMAEKYSGPIPHPQVLKGFDLIVPGSAQLIINNALKESDHRREMNTLIVKGGVDQQKRGQDYGLIIALSFLVVSAIIILAGYPTEGCILGSIDIVALVSVFVVGHLRKDKEDNDDSE